MGKLKNIIAVLSDGLSYGRYVRVEALRGGKKENSRGIKIKWREGDRRDEIFYFQILLDDSRRRRWWRRSERLVRVWGLRFEVNAGGDVISR